MVQNIEHDTLCHTGQTATLHQSGEHSKMAALGYVNTRGDKLCTHPNAVLIGLPLAVRYLPFTSICESSYVHDLGPYVGVPRISLGACKNSVGRRARKIMLRIWKDQMGYAFLLCVLLLALGTLSSSKRWKKPIHSLQLFFAAAVWLVLPKRSNTLRWE